MTGKQRGDGWTAERVIQDTAADYRRHQGRELDNAMEEERAALDAVDIELRTRVQAKLNIQDGHERLSTRWRHVSCV
jgi:hypothetical protein